MVFAYLLLPGINDRSSDIRQLAKWFKGKNCLLYTSMLPYKTLAFSKIEGRHGTYALIDKGENRDREIRKPRPSVRAQLKTDKAKTAPKKAAAKNKNHDLEV